MDLHTMLRALALIVCAAMAPTLRAASIRATRENDGTIRVLAPGKFETTFTRQKGFGSTWYDLKHDPQRQRDLAPVADENGILWTKTRGGDLLPQKRRHRVLRVLARARVAQVVPGASMSARSRPALPRALELPEGNGQSDQPSR